MSTRVSLGLFAVVLSCLAGPVSLSQTQSQVVLRPVWNARPNWSFAGRTEAPGRPFAFSNCHAWLNAETKAVLQICNDRDWLGKKPRTEVESLFLSPPELLEGRSYLAENLMSFFFPAPDDFWKSGQVQSLLGKITGGKLAEKEIEKYVVGVDQKNNKVALVVELEPKDLREFYVSSLGSGAVITLQKGTVDIDVAFAEHSFGSLGSLDAGSSNDWFGFVLAAQKPLSGSWMTKFGLPADSPGKKVRFFWLLGKTGPDQLTHVVLAEVWDGSSGFESLAAAVRGLQGQGDKPFLADAPKLAESIAAAAPPAPWRHNDDSWKAKFGLEVVSTQQAASREPVSVQEMKEIQSLVASGKADQAIDELRSFVAKNPDDPDSRLLLASLLMVKRAVPEALEQAQLAVQRAPQNAKAHTLLGFCLAAAGNLDEGEKELRRALEIEPQSAQSHYELGWVLNHRKQPDLAIPEFRKAIELDPRYATAWFDLGVSFHMKSNLEQAAEAYRRSIEVDPTNPDPYVNLCGIYSDRGDGERLIQTCEAGLKVAPNNAGLLNNLAWFYATAKQAGFRNPAKALDYAQKAVSPSGEREPGILDTLAEAYYVNQNYEKAIETETKALALRPNDKSLQDSLEKYKSAKRAKR